MLILFWLLACMYVSQCKIIIKDVGVATLTRGDVGMIFYITLRNIGNCKYNVNVKMVKCCENFAADDLDCKLMNLIGGDMGVLPPNITKNISLLYPNMYLHNRKGQCLICLKYRTERGHSFEAKETIAFNTFIQEKSINPILRGYYDKREYKKCKTVDEDPLDDCQPIDCHMKYLGCRNFFNRKWRRCQKVPICVADPEKSLPDVSYIPISNMCRDLEDLISITDLKHLDKGVSHDGLESQPAPDLLANVHCHHGFLSNETGFCICDDGWMSAPLDKDQYEPSLSIYHMCNIEIDTWNNVNSSKIKMTAILLVVFGGLTTIFIIMLSFICHFLYICITPRKANDKHGKMYPKKSEGSFNIIEEMASMRTRPSISVAAKRDSKAFQKRAAQHYKGLSDASLQIVEKITHLSSITDDATEDTDVEVGHTESFIPTRPKDDNPLDIKRDFKNLQKRTSPHPKSLPRSSLRKSESPPNTDMEAEQSGSFLPTRSKDIVSPAVRRDSHSSARETEKLQDDTEDTTEDDTDLEEE